MAGKKKRGPPGVAPKPQATARSWQALPGVTSGPGTSLERTTATWESGEATNAPEVGEIERVEGYASTAPELVDKILHGRKPLGLPIVASVLVLGWFGFLSWLFLQDNNRGKLDTIQGLQSFGIKAAVYSAIALVVGLIILGIGVFHNKRRYR